MALKLVVLSRSRRISSTRRLVEAAQARGHAVRVLGPTEIDLHLGGRSSGLMRGAKRLRIPDVVIPRVAASIASYGLTVLEQFAMRGVPVMNSPRAIGLSRNPARCLQLLVNVGLEVPATVLARSVRDLRALVNTLGGVPVLVKLLQGSERRGLMVCESVQSLEAALEAVFGLGHNIVLQEYVREASRDLRVFVVGGHALACVARTAAPARLVRSLARHGRLEKCQMSPEVAQAAERAATACGLEVCAVDLLEVDGQPRIFEVNASPALADMELATGIDLATPVIVRAEALVAEHA